MDRLDDRQPHAPTTKAARQAGNARRGRIVLAAAGFLALFCVLGVRLGGLALSGAQDLSFLTAKTEADHPRADIVDRRGMLLATDVSVWAAYADPHRVWDPAETARQLRTVLPHLDEKDLARRLAGEGRFVWIERELTPQEQYRIHNLGLPGVAFLPERKRFYPHAEAIAHVLGYVDIDGEGIAGVEMALNDALKGRTHADEPAVLSIDLRVQHSLFNELGTAMRTFKAKGAAGVVLKADTGEIVAMASLPSFNPNHLEAANANARFNRATAGVYELGSILKAFTVATALETGTVRLTDGYDASKPIQYGRYRITDYHAENRWLTVPEIFYHSSNIGSAKMALDIGTERQRAYLRRFGLLTRAALDLPEVGAPLYPARWGELETMTIGFGHGLAVSPLQVTVAAAALVNGGCMVTPTLLHVENARPGPCKRVISEKTSAVMRRLLRQVVEEGTGRKADVKGFPVGGKTGTAEKPERGGYNRRKLISSFLGVFPAQEPEYVVLAVLDEPKGTKETFHFATAGWTAAPTVGNIVRRIAPMVGVMPVFNDEDEDRRVADAGGQRFAARSPGTDMVSSRFTR